VRAIVAALALGVAGGLLAYVHLAQPYYPVVTIAAPDGLTYIAVQDATSEREACDTANARFVAPIKASCKACKVLAARCERFAGDFASSSHRLVAPGLRMTIEGPDAPARRDCDSIAKDIASRGVRGAACIYPKSDAPRA
jgi:hypothetical protein